MTQQFTRSHSVSMERVSPPSRLILRGTPGQLKVLAGIKRFTSVFASRRFGKTTLGCLRVLQKMARPNPIGLIWWISPTYRQCRVPFERLISALRRSALIESISRQDMSLRLKTGWRFECRTAERPDNLRAEGLDLCVEDEQGLITDVTFYECIRPMLIDTGGEWLGLGTPKGRRGHGYENWRRAQAGEPGYAGFRFTAFDGTFIPRGEILEARKHMPRRAFEQELMASFLDVVGVVFEDVRRKPRLTPIDGEPVGVGIDWAKKVDWTWFVAAGAKSGAILGWYRAPHKLSYPRQVELAVEFCDKLRAQGHRVAKVVHDQTGVGEAVADIMRASRHPVISEAEGIVFTEPRKRVLVEEAVVAFESGQLGFVEGTEISDTGELMIKEHEDYALGVSGKGKIGYGAPEGLHDDAVTAVFLANRARRASVAGIAVNPRVSWI